jgi:hypothetical protein
MKHKHAELIKAWADGAEIEYLRDFMWQPAINPAWSLSGQYRIKPKPQEPQYLYVYNHKIEGKTWMSPTFMQETYGTWNYIGKVEVTK